MKSFITFGLIAAAAAIPAPQASGRGANICPRINGTQATSNNNQKYNISCSKWVDGEVIRIVDTEIGYAGCLTACDGTIGCTSVQYIATNRRQTKGSCTVFKNGEIKDGSSNSWTVAVPVNAPSTTPSPTPSATPVPSRFGGIAIRSGSEIQYLSVNANGQSFWLNKNTTTYCPDTVVPCPNITSPQTIFAKSNETETLSLDVSVPGGQQVYVSETGELKFTGAHSASMGNGSVATGFAIQDGGLTFQNQSWFACPLGLQNGNAFGIYAVSMVKGSNAGGSCYGFKFRVQDAGNATSVWQYV